MINLEKKKQIGKVPCPLLLRTPASAPYFHPLFTRCILVIGSTLFEITSISDSGR